MRAKFFVFIIMLSILTTSLTNTAFAGGRGTTASDLIGARSAVFGEGFVAVADDANTLIYNPAGLPLLLQPEFTASHFSLLGMGAFVNYSKRSSAINQDFIALAMPNGKIPFGVSIFTLGTNMPYADKTGYIMETRSYNERMLTLSVGKRLKSGRFAISTGANLNYLNINGGDNTSDIGIDGGILMNTPGILPDFGLVIKGLGTGTPLKMDLATCLNPLRSIRFVGGISKVVGSSTFQYSGGAEYFFRWFGPVNLAFFAGYRGLGDLKTNSLESRAESASTGFYIRTGRTRFDYSYEKHSVMEETHKFTFTYFLEAPELFHLNTGKKAFEKIDDEKAIYEFKEALYLSPRNIEAFHLMALSYERMRNKDKAIELLERVKRIDKEYSKENNIEQIIKDIKEQD